MDPAVNEAWHDFFVAETGAAAALAGLLVVAISINIKEIIDGTGLPGRAAETILFLGGALIESSIMLVPDLSPGVRGGAVFVVAVIVWSLPAISQSRLHRRMHGHPEHFWNRVMLTQMAALPAVVAGALLVFDITGGRYVLAIGILASFAVALVNAWVLLVEILR